MVTYHSQRNIGSKYFRSEEYCNIPMGSKRFVVFKKEVKRNFVATHSDKVVWSLYSAL